MNFLHTACVSICYVSNLLLLIICVLKTVCRTFRGRINLNCIHIFYISNSTSCVVNYVFTACTNVCTYLEYLIGYLVDGKRDLILIFSLQSKNRQLDLTTCQYTLFIETYFVSRVLHAIRMVLSQCICVYIYIDIHIHIYIFTITCFACLSRSLQDDSSGIRATLVLPGRSFYGRRNNPVVISRGFGGKTPAREDDGGDFSKTRCHSRTFYFRRQPRRKPTAE